MWNTVGNQTSFFRKGNKSSDNKAQVRKLNTRVSAIFSYFICVQQIYNNDYFLTIIIGIFGVFFVLFESGKNHGSVLN